MTRRILIALVTLIIALVAGAMVPLGIQAADHDRTAFLQETADDTAIYESAEQPILADQHANVAVVAMMAKAREIGETVQAPSAKGGSQSLRAKVPAQWWTLVNDVYMQANHAATNETASTSPQVRVTSATVAAAIAVTKNNDGPPVGVVLVTRSAAPLNNEIRTLWTILAAIGLVAVLCASLLAIWLARWVSRPLAGLDATAGRLADGELGSRAVTDVGPPELRRLARTFNTMAGRLENLVHGSRAVLADVSHQLRTPLAALRLRLDLLTADAAETDPELAAELSGAQDELTRLNRLVDGLLAVARADNVQPQPQVVDVGDIVTERVAAWLPVAEDRGIELTNEDTADYDGAAYGYEPVLGWIGEGHLEQVLDNLIANALDAVRPEDTITVLAERAGGRVRVLVRDTGPGMSPEDQERAFLRFTSNSPGGTGIGLAIVHRLVTSNGGTASLTDTPGGGLTVALDLPGADLPAREPDPAVGTPSRLQETPGRL